MWFLLLLNMRSAASLCFPTPPPQAEPLAWACGTRSEGRHSISMGALAHCPFPRVVFFFFFFFFALTVRGDAEEPLFGRLSFKFLAVRLLRPSLSYILVTSLDLLWLSGLHSFSLRFFAIPQEALFAFLQYRDELLPLKQIITKRAF